MVAGCNYFRVARELEYLMQPDVIGQAVANLAANPDWRSAAAERTRPLCC